MRIGLSAAAAAAAVLALAPGASAKEFTPGDLRICNTQRCVAVKSRPALQALFQLYYADPSPDLAPRARLGARSYQLRYRNDYVTGIVAGATLDRFLSHGVHLGHFTRGHWYRVPLPAARELRRLAAGLESIPLTRDAIDRSR